VNYFDASYIIRLYFDEPGWKEVYALRTTEPWACSLHGQGEVFAAMHRKYREGLTSTDGLRFAITQFRNDSEHGAFHWFPIREQMVAGLGDYFQDLPPTVFLRAADAIHLASARDHGCSVVYSNDKRMLEAAADFGLRGKNVIL
jgi:predicted nucleic acid-binding protein